MLKSKPGVSGTLAGAGKCSSCALQGRRLRDGLVSGLSRALLVGGSHLQRMWSFFFLFKIGILCHKSAHLHRLIRGTAAFLTLWQDLPRWAQRAGSPSGKTEQEPIHPQQPRQVVGSHQRPTPDSSTPEDKENYSVPFVTNLNPACCCSVRTESGSATKAHGAAGLITATHWRGSHTHQPSRSSTELCHCRSTFQIYI